MYFDTEKTLSSIYRLTSKYRNKDYSTTVMGSLEHKSSDGGHL